MSRLDQDDFFLLAVSGVVDGPSLHEQQGCGDMMDDSYVPVNIIKPEVYALIQLWNAKEQKSGNSHAEQTKIDFSETEGSNLEPTRCMHSIQTPAPPPKRFYRRFWKSITRRILEKENENALKVRMC